jgi:molecular chaperone GrpE (heat shock protein)
MTTKKELPLIEQLREKITKDYSTPVDYSLQRMLRKSLEALDNLKGVLEAADKTKKQIKKAKTE